MARQGKKSTARSNRSSKADQQSVASIPRSSSRPSGATPTQESRAAPPGWMWLLGGIVIGGLAFSALQLIRDGEETEPQILQPGAGNQDQESASAAPSSKREEGGGTATEAGEDSGERSYEFYDILMKDEVAIPEDALPPADPRRTKEKKEDVEQAPTIEAGYSYLLQAGSFRNRDDAEHLRATLALVGLQARVHTVELDDGQKWHRVRVGPMEAQEEIKKARKRMREHNIEPLLLRESG